MPRLTAALQRGFLFVSGRENRWGAAVSGGNRRAQTAIGVHRQQAAGALILAERGVV